MLVHQYLEQSARNAPGRVALIAGDQRLSYGQLDSDANRLANALIALGVRRSDRVLIFMDNCPELVVSVFAVLKAGAIFSVVNASTKSEKLAFLLRNTSPACIITTADRQRLQVLSEILPTVQVPVVLWLGGAPEIFPASDTRHMSYEVVLADTYDLQPETGSIDLDLATIIYTSGSTGSPKGVMCTHANVVFATNSISDYLGITEVDVIFCALPLAFDYGLYQLFLSTRVGATLVLERNFAFPQQALQIMARENVTIFPGVPSMFALLLGMKNPGVHKLDALRVITNTAAALPVSHILSMRAAIPQARLFSMYGLTECKRVSFLPPEELDRRPDSVGIAIPGTEVYCVDDLGRRLPSGEVGELVVRGSHVMRGYWLMPEETAQRYRPGPVPGEAVLYTGDLFRMDEDGFLYFVGRRDDIIKSRGEKVSPKEIENVVAAIEGVLDAAVVGIPDPLLGQAIVIFVLPKPYVELTERAIRAQCARLLEDFMAPKYVHIVSELPTGDTGKVDKKRLQQCAASLAG